MEREKKFLKGIELHTGLTVTRVEVVADYVVEDTWVIRAHFVSDRTVDFLLVGREFDGGTKKMEAKDVSDHLEEVLLTTWPPVRDRYHR